ncbi:sulfite exporter TauE/SafE family protein [Paenibacillus sp. GYB004]|uniref:urease accessory protein UreH domain-containing protein n=1 Tax=Paenibacillus sp. GYB004 TaxID=2994393 RepID=UPI002F96AC53
MYSFFSTISAFLSVPFINASQSNVALLAALFLGFIGSVAPCQISANVATITYFANRQVQSKLSWTETVLYLLGKVVLFSFFGILFWVFGQQISRDFIPLFASARKLLGPLLLVIGLFLLGWIRLPFHIGTRFSKFMYNIAEPIGGKGGAFLMGIAFSIGFCPTMFVLFFGSLMPLALESSYGVFLPSVFAAGTAMPFLLFAALAVGFGLDRVMVRRAKHFGLWIQRLAGILFIILGVSDTLTYWTL